MRALGIAVPLLNCALRKRGICENILLEHEGACPDWLAAAAEKAVALGEQPIATEVTQEAF